MRKLFFLAVLLVFGLGILLFLRFGRFGEAEAVRADKTELGGASRTACAGGSGKTLRLQTGSVSRANRRLKKMKVGRPDGDDANEDGEHPDWTPEEKRLAADIERASDEEDFELAKKCAPLALVCGDVEIRQAMVDTLGWFGKRALPELTPFLADSDEDVRESACNEWSTAVSDIDDEHAKIAAVEMAMNTLSDEDFLENISSEYIGVDEKLAVESLMRIIADGKSGKGVAKAKETYEFITGDEWQGEAEAGRWIREEYEPAGK